MLAVTPVASRSKWDQVPRDPRSQKINFGFNTPGGFFPSNISGILQNMPDKVEHAISDDVLDSFLPSEGYEIVRYSAVGASDYQRDTSALSLVQKLALTIGITANLNAEDVEFFRSALFPAEGNEGEVEVLKLLLKIKFGAPAMRRSASSALVDHLDSLGCETIIRHVLGIVMLSSVSTQDRHYILKLLKRLINRSGKSAASMTSSILTIIEPLLRDADYFVRSEGREVLCELAKGVGFVPLLQSFKDELGHPDEEVRKTSAKAFAIVAMELGLETFDKFLAALCHPRVSTGLRVSGLRCIQSLALLAGRSVLPHIQSFLKSSIECFETDDDLLQINALLAIASLAQASYPYGFDAFAPHLNQLIQRLLVSRNKSACLKCIGLIVNLHNSHLSESQSVNMISVCIKLLTSRDANTHRIVINFISNCICNESFLHQFVLDQFFDDFLRLLLNVLSQQELDHSSSRALLIFFLKIGKRYRRCSLKIVRWISNALTQLGSKANIRVLLSTLPKVVEMASLTPQDVDVIHERLIEVSFTKCTDCWRELLDALRQINCSNVSLIETGVENALRQYSSTEGKQISVALAVIEGSLGTISKMSMGSCLRRTIMSLYEQVDSDDPLLVSHVLRVLGKALMADEYKCTLPPVKDIVLRLTTVLRNRNEFVQEACSQVIGDIARALPEIISVREWMRMCFELLDILGCPRKSARRQAILAFSAISKAIGPSDIMIALLNNLKVQERQNRLNTTIAIAIVAESCGPFTVLPLLLNEYRVPELNVQNGVLKALCFLFEYLAQAAHHYLYSVVTLLEDALMERDIVHRQIACSVFRQMCIVGYGYFPEDLAIHLLNYVWPNIFEPSAPALLVVLEAIDACRLLLGAGFIAQYCIQGLFHPARKVREVYWRIYNNLVVSSADALAATLDRSIFPADHASPIDVFF
jgi:splicing factor 3B subunit 1